LSQTRGTNIENWRVRLSWARLGQTYMLRLVKPGQEVKQGAKRVGFGWVRLGQAKLV